jgi:hypothetical protein
VRVIDDSVVTGGELALLVDGLMADVWFGWALIRLGLRENPPRETVPPTLEMVAEAFGSFEWLVSLGLVEIGRFEFSDAAEPAGSLIPVKLAAEPINRVRDRVEWECVQPSPDTAWAFACWLVNTDAGNELARKHA